MCLFHHHCHFGGRHLHLTNAKALGLGTDDAQSVGVAHATLPALNDDDGIASRQGTELQSLADGPLDTLVDILLPVNLAEVGLSLGEEEGVDATVQVSEARCGGVSGNHEDGADRAVLGEETSRLARGGEDNDTTGAEIEGGADGGHGAGLDGADGALDEAAHLLKVGDVGNGVLGLEAGLVHLADGLGGVVALGSLARQHDAVGTVGNGIANVANLGAGRAGVLDHGLEHLGGADDGLASQVAHGNHLLLGGKDLGGGNLDAEITTGDHDTVRLGENLGEIVQTLAVLNLGNDLDASTLGAEDGTNVLDVLAGADKRGKDHVDVVLDTKLEIGLVLVGQGGQIDIGVGQVDTLAGGNEAVVASAGLDGLVVLDGEDVEGEDTVVHVDDAARLDHLGNVLVVDVPGEVSNWRRLK